MSKPKAKLGKSAEDKWVHEQILPDLAKIDVECKEEMSNSKKLETKEVFERNNGLNM